MRLPCSPNFTPQIKNIKIFYFFTSLVVSRGLKQKETKNCKAESLQHWQVKSEANGKGLGERSSVSASLATKFEELDLDEIELWEKNLIMKVLFQTVLHLFLSIIWYLSILQISLIMTPPKKYLDNFQNSNWSVHIKPNYCYYSQSILVNKLIL